MFLEIFYAIPTLIVRYLVKLGVQGGLEGPYTEHKSREFITELLLPDNRFATKTIKNDRK